MSSTVHYRAPVDSSPSAASGGKPRGTALLAVLVLVMAFVALLLTGIIFLVSGTDTAGMVPHPEPLPAPSAPPIRGH